MRPEAAGPRGPRAHSRPPQQGHCAAHSPKPPAHGREDLQRLSTKQPRHLIIKVSESQNQKGREPGWTSQVALTCSVGRSMKTCRSNRPGLSRALSKMSARLVAARTMTWSVVPIPGGTDSGHEGADPNWAASPWTARTVAPPEKVSTTQCVGGTTHVSFADGKVKVSHGNKSLAGGQGPGQT